MSASRPRLSVVCPAYQEEEVLPIFHTELSRALAPLAAEFPTEVVYVDDGSTDGTLAVLRRLAAADPRVRYLSFSRNFGHQAAVTAGLEHARGDLVVSLDTDLQHPPALIPVLIDEWRKGYDLVLTEREYPPATGWFKRVSSAWFYHVMGRLSNVPVKPAASDFRLMSRPAVDAVLRMREAHRFLRGMVSWVGFKVVSVPFRAAERAAGHTRFTFRSLMRLASDGLLSFSSLPLRLPLYAGAGLLLLAALHALLVPTCALLGAGVGPWALHVTAGLTLWLNGLVLTSVGVLGEYLGRVYEQVKQRPLYVLRETSVDSGAQRSLGPPGNAAA
ncbi:MAG: glycosyltransferase family 2 protein [Gemmataceae bacterium]